MVTEQLRRASSPGDHDPSKDRLRNRILRLYNSGLSKTEVARRVDRTRQTVTKVIQEAESAQVVADFNQGKAVGAIAHELGSTEQYVRAVLERAGCANVE